MGRTNVETYCRALKQRLVQEGTRALNATAQEGVRLGQDLSKGPYTAALLTAMGRPYARRRPRPPLPSYIINYQTGRFYNAWKMQPAHATNALLIATVLNQSPEAAELDQGTLFAIPRPTRQILEATLTPRLQQRIRAAIRRL